MKQKKRTEQEPRQPVKEKNYVLPKTRGMLVCRTILWCMIGFIFARGVIACLQPSDARQVQQTIENFKRDFAEYKGENEEILSFAQNFAKEYLTFYVNDTDGYKARIRPYVSDRIYNMADSLWTFQSDSRATYVSAYRKEQYSDRQFDVYVQAEVTYGNLIDTTTLRIPIYAAGGAYIVEGIPMVVRDSMLLADFQQADYAGKPVTEAEQVSMEVSVQNFLKAYYEEDRDILEYYLAPDAQREHFVGLYGRYTFVSLDSLKCYQEPGSQDIVAIATVTIKDADSLNQLAQEYHLILANQNGRYYIRDFNTKKANI